MSKFASKCVKFISEQRNQELNAEESFFYGLAAREVAHAFFVRVRLPQTKLDLKHPHCAVHVRDDTPPYLQLQVQHIKMA